MKKWTLAGAAALALGLLLTLQAWAAQPIRLFVNGSELLPDIPVEARSGRVLVPLRWVAEALGAEVEYDPESQRVLVEAADKALLQQQIKLLEEALAPATAEAAAETWGRGVQSRNGALQFAVMTPELRAQWRPAFEALNWVTGVSSPWIERYTVTPLSEGQFRIEFHLATSTGDAGSRLSTLTVTQQGGSWLVSEIREADVLRGKVQELAGNRFLLEGPLMSNGEPALYWITITEQTQVLGGELQVGQQVTVEVDGAILESFPAQAAAATVRIVE